MKFASRPSISTQSIPTIKDEAFALDLDSCMSLTRLQSMHVLIAINWAWPQLEKQLETEWAAKRVWSGGSGVWEPEWPCWFAHAHDLVVPYHNKVHQRSGFRIAETIFTNLFFFCCRFIRSRKWAALAALRTYWVSLLVLIWKHGSCW